METMTGFVKSPSAALSFALCHCVVAKSTPHSSWLARLAYGAFYCAVREIIVLTALMVVFPIYGYCAEKAMGWKLISPEKVYSLIKEGSGLWLVDVRGELSFGEEHIEGSINIPVSSLEGKQFPKNKMIVIVDDSLGQRYAREAAGKIADKGYQKVYILDRGAAGWKMEGYPVVGQMGIVPLSKAVAKEELKWAIDSGIPIKIYDMRDPGAVKAGSISKAMTVEGSDLAVRIDNLKKQLKKPPPLGPPLAKGGNRGGDLSKRLEGPPTVVLVFSANDDAQSLADRAAFGAYGDVRYLQGGYETWMSKVEDRKMISQGCPSCPKSQK